MLKTKNNFNKKVFLILILFAATVLLTGCISFKGGDKNKNQAPAKPLGFHKSMDAAGTWQTKGQILNVEGQKKTINNITIKRIIKDPSDNNTLYLVSQQGMYYSLTAGDSWQKVGKFTGSINDLAIDYFDKCNIFVATGQSIYKSSDCSRNWKEVFLDKRQGLQITDVEADSYNDNVVYAANNKGEVLKSIDYGLNWQTIKRTNKNVIQILIDKDDTRIIYVVVLKGGIYKTMDGGITWSDDDKATDLNQSLKKFKNSTSSGILVQDMTAKDSLLYASKYGLLRSSDGGLNWEHIELITPINKANIYSLAIDPKESNNIYYGTETTLYKTNDGGANWKTLRSPTGGWLNYLLIDSVNSSIVYLGGKALPEKK